MNYPDLVPYTLELVSIDFWSGLYLVGHRAIHLSCDKLNFINLILD